MNTKILSYLLLFCFAPLAACSGYHPVGETGGFSHGGYSSTRVDANTVIVNFSSILTPTGTINQYVLYRAAKITIDSGFDYFVVVSTSASTTNMNIRTTSTLTPVQPPTLFNTYYQPAQLQSYSTSTSKLQCPCPKKRTGLLDQRTSTAVIKMFNGPIPANLPNAYNPYDIVAHTQAIQDDTTPQMPFP